MVGLAYPWRSKQRYPSHYKFAQRVQIMDYIAALSLRPVFSFNLIKILFHPPPILARNILEKIHVFTNTKFLNVTMYQHTMQGEYSQP